MKDTSDEVAEKMKSGQVLNGIGMFGRVGYAPASTNTITRDASVALFAHGLFDSRPYDSFGAGLYYNAISRDLKNIVTAAQFARVFVVSGEADRGHEQHVDRHRRPSARAA